MSESKFSEIENSGGRPLLCLEVNPPRGVGLEDVFERLEGNLAGIDFFNITDSALARMRFSPLPFASLLKQRFGLEPLVNISCRDRNLIAIQADLLAGWATGVRSIVALTGDAVTVGDSPERKGVFEVNSVGLLKVVLTMNQGKDLAGNELEGAPNYFPGVVVNPNVRNMAAEIKKLVRKKEAGARYALSQPVFDEEQSAQFFREAQSTGVPIFMGLLAFRTAKSMLGISKVPGIRLPESMLAEAAVNPAADCSESSMAHCLKLARRNRPYVRGFHVVSGTTPKLALKLARQLADLIRAEFNN